MRDTASSAATPTDPATLAPPRVALGRSLPGDLREVPTLEPLGSTDPSPGHSMLAAGWLYQGQADIAGSLTVACEVQGILRLRPGPAGHGEGHVTISPEGRVVGDILARSISVLGQTEGLLEAARVSLHDSSVVTGHVRYGHLQVNGADLNGQLERLRPGSDSA